jgi:type I restriction enzyme S subunit
VPESWKWCRLGTIIQSTSGGTPERTNPDYWKGNINWLKSGELNDGYIEVPSEEKITSEGLNNSSAKLFPKGTLLIALYGATAGKLGILNYESSTNQAICGFFENKNVETKYLFHFFMSLREKMIADSWGQAQPNISQSYLKQLCFPLPPLAEQQRIVNQLETLVPLITEYDKYEKQEAQLTADFPNTLKKTILQSAIQGKLVAQNPDDEPASVLLDKIRKEKEQLIKLGKLKRGKTESFIYKDTTDNSYYESRNGKVLCIDAEIPFEIPESWEWCRLKDIIELYSGRDLLPQEYNADNQGVPYITGASNISNGKIAVNRWTKTPAVVSINGDLLISCKGTVGAMAFNVLGNIHIARQIMAIRALYFDIEYIRMFLSWYMPNLIQQAKSMIPGISREHILDALIPVPPIKEQKRIIEKVNMIFALFY